ncbi:hypothetical protein ACJOV8_017225 [Formosa sp. 3Alg 14/1]|uniref:hypothetical protein n=1 Tax=Formosa sp. 3Alg 14/1 TaxID=3382190 RepID=UPI0039BDD24D
MKIRFHLFIVLMLLVSFSIKVKAQHQYPSPLILDMVHHNPGEAPYKTAYNDPAVIKEMGYNGKVYFLFESPALAINWESVDKDILPKGSEDRKWVDAKAEQIKKMHAQCKAEDMAIYAMSDLVLFPKRLIKKYEIEDTFGDPNHPLTEKFVRAQINEMFDQFPDLDGLVVRIGETYLHDAPYHQGAIDDKSSPEKTIIPLMKMLKEEICVKRDKQLIFRTWNAFDRNMSPYLEVSNAVQPHKNLIISIKQCEGDFHRGRPFSKLIGQGRHPQIIEVQSAREYEGKGAYPNYIANGVIEGFEEHAKMPEGDINSIREFVETTPDLYAGIWTWSRGGGWEGPYVKSEMWCDLNSWVMAQWAQNTEQSEAFIFKRYATERLNLKGDDVAKFRRLCLLSAEAVIRGRNTVQNDISDVWWTRDQGIGWPAVAKDAVGQKRNLEQKDESIAKWEEIVALSKAITWDNEAAKSHAIGSAEYGLRLYKIYRALVYMSDAEAKGDVKEIKKWITIYDKSWADYNKLPKQYNRVATLYTQDYNRHIAHNANQKVNELRTQK